MKDTKPRVLHQEVPVEGQLTAKDLRQAVALGTGDLLHTALNAYTSRLSVELDEIRISDEGEELLAHLIDKPNSGFANRSSFKRMLLNPLAHDIMYIIWRESEFIPDAVLMEAKLGRQFREPEKYLTRNSLKNAICDDRKHITASGGDALKRSIDRICDALEVYGLIDRAHIRQNLKPINGTQQLDALMSNAHTPASHIFADQLQSDGGERNG